MKQKINRYYLHVIIINLTIFLAFSLSTRYFNPAIPQGAFLFTLSWFTIVALITWSIIKKSIKSAPKKSAFIVFTTIGVKLLLYLCFIIIYLLVFKELSKNFAFFFFTCYIVFTSVTLVDILNFLKQKS